MCTCANTAAPSVSLYLVTRSTNSQLKVLQQCSVGVRSLLDCSQDSTRACRLSTGNKGSAAAQHAANCHNRYAAMHCPVLHTFRVDPCTAAANKKMSEMILVHLEPSHRQQAATDLQGLQAEPLGLWGCDVVNA
jgi:hypothetical protein